MRTVPSPHFFLGPVRVDALPWRDVRVAQVALLLVFSLLGHLVLHFTVSALQAGCALAGAMLAEELASVRQKQRLVVPASALITGLSLGLLLRSTQVWPFAAAGVVAIASKYGVRARGRHVFNPSNVGLVVTLAVIPGSSVAPGQWGSSWVWLFFLANCGLSCFIRSTGSPSWPPSWAPWLWPTWP